MDHQFLAVALFFWYFAILGLIYWLLTASDRQIARMKSDPNEAWNVANCQAEEAIAFYKANYRRSLNAPAEKAKRQVHNLIRHFQHRPSGLFELIAGFLAFALFLLDDDVVHGAHEFGSGFINRFDLLFVINRAHGQPVQLG